VADGLKQVSLAEAGIPIDKQWIIRIARRLAYGYAACMGKPVTGTYDEIFKSIIRVEDGRCPVSFFGWFLFYLAVCGKLHADKVACYLLCGACKGTSAFTLQKLCAHFIGTADFKRPARQPHEIEAVKPFTGVDGIQSPCSVEYFSEDIFDFTAGQDVLLYKNPLRADKTTPQ
jgi:hypothetical protein